jgi:hypothetical protein
MTTYELQHRFNLEMEKYNIFDPVMSIIVQDYINYAYQQYVTEKYDSLINPIEKFEVTERISRILAPLLYDFNATSFTSITTNSPYGYYCTGPSDLQYIIKEKAVVNTTDCNGTATTVTVKVVPIKHSMLSSNENNPFLKPDDTEIWRVNFSGRKIELILTSGQSLVSYTCRYLKKHLKVNFATSVTMEIDDSVHEEVVVKAAYMYLGALNKKENVK